MKYKSVSLALLAVSMIFVAGACTDGKTPGRHKSEVGSVSFHSSDSALNQAFAWARQRALGFAHSDDPVGPWYDAALPNREAFCMRDVAHQATGAAVLGLGSHNYNMLAKFAASVSDSKDWCSFWEINRYNQPAPVDYRTDDDFWYNLPANFDVMQACYLQYLWSGDERYLQDSLFIRFYCTTVHEYVERWDLGAQRLLKRDRLINVQDRENPGSTFYFDRRGIPTYNEGGRGPARLGIDLSASLVAGYRVYGNIMERNGDLEEAVWSRSRAEEIEKLLEDFWWDPERNEYRSIWYSDGSMDHFRVGRTQAFLVYLLHFGVLYDISRIHSILKAYVELGDSLIVELASYLPRYYYQFGLPEVATALISRLSSPENSRRDYPEVSFAIIGDLTTGLMGIEPDATTGTIETCPGLPADMAFARMYNVPVFDGTVCLLHEGKRSSILVNGTGRTVIWKPAFAGSFDVCTVNGRMQQSVIMRDAYGRIRTILEISLKPGEKAIARVN